MNPDLLFGSSQEKVGVDDDKNDKRGENDNREKANSSPSFYSSILSAFRDDGLLPELTDEEIENVKDDTDVKELFNKVLDSRLDQRTKRIQDALNGGADIQEVKQYENILAQLTNISEDAVSEEGEAGEDLRRRIIAQDYMNRGFSRERIERELRKSFNAGTDIDDAKEALQNNIQFFTEKYQGIIRQGQERDKQFRDNTRKQGEELRKSIVESDEGIFGEIGVDKKTR